MENILNNEEYIYLTIPVAYQDTYKRIMIVLSEYGEDMLKDCKAACKDRNSNIVDCFNMFNSALAAYELGKVKLANTIIKYINAKLIQIYGGTIDVKPHPIDETYWYVGQITKTRSQFAALNAQELIACSTRYPSSVKKAEFTITNSCWFILIREDMSVQSASYKVGAFESTFTKQEIENGFNNNTRHDDVIINDVVYHCYVNRNVALVDSSALGTFNIE